MDYQTKIQILEKKIQEYKTQYPQRNWEQKHKLNVLYLELIYWQLAAKGEIKLDPLFFKAQELWQNLKKSYHNKGKWPRKELEVFLAKQTPDYREYLINLIQQETNPEYLKFACLLSKKLKRLS